MLSMIRPRLSYANVMATVAMFLALGGTSLAVAQEPDEPASERSAESTETSDAQGAEEVDAVRIAVRDGLDASTDEGSLEVTVSAKCEESEILTGGGVRTIDADGSKPVVQSSHPSSDDPRTWTAIVANANGNGKVTAVAYALCASG